MVARRMTGPRTARGTTMIEILVTIVIVAFGLLGMAGLQMRMQMSETEAYQRSQALMLANDMASRIATNRINAASYVTGTTAIGGPSYNCTGITSTVSQVQSDLREWCAAIQGQSELSKTGSTTTYQGATINGQGCVVNSPTGDGDYMVTVVWQGLTPISAPPTSVACGQNNYDGTGTSACTNDRCRRFVTMIVRIKSLT